MDLRAAVCLVLLVYPPPDTTGVSLPPVHNRGQTPLLPVILLAFVAGGRQPRYRALLLRRLAARSAVYRAVSRFVCGATWHCRWRQPRSPA